MGMRRAKTLYFAYTSMIAPERLQQVAPGAEFRFIAHLPETRLIFPSTNGSWDGALPSVRAEPGNTVWGAIFEVPDGELQAIDRAEAAEGRRRTILSAMDRAGRRYDVVTHVLEEESNGELRPSREYMTLVVKGGRHWSLPAGWVAGLEEYVDDASW
ncbi:MAG: gamma-glutamylcyclotransferase [Actinomycetota bacterium]|nr:gamma-glutamylcyclotransferase [Actinomycetota bacterium]